jgi:hypothetical protein
MARKIGSLGTEKSRAARKMPAKKSKKSGKSAAEKTVPAGNPPGAGKNPPKIPRSP